MTNEEMRKYDYMVECGIATSEELNLAFNLLPMDWEGVINEVVYVRTGYQSFEQMIEEMEEEDF